MLSVYILDKFPFKHFRSKVKVTVVIFRKIVSWFQHLLYEQSLNSRQVFNPIALRKAKIAYSFGLIECNRFLAKFAFQCYRDEVAFFFFQKNFVTAVAPSFMDQF